jgi:hypothetical protein
MTSGLQRGSNLPADVPKTMVIPEEREADFERKMKSPLFGEHFQNGGWTLLYFNALRETFTKTKTKTAIESLLGQKKYTSLRPGGQDSDNTQKLMEFASPGASSLPRET